MVLSKSKVLSLNFKRPTLLGQAPTTTTKQNQCNQFLHAKSVLDGVADKLNETMDATTRTALMMVIWTHDILCE